jgi:hypothetical protein
VSLNWRKALMTDRRKNPAREKTEAKGKTIVRQYHIVPNCKRWNVEWDHTFTGSFAYAVHTAIGFATAEAQKDAHNGLDATVCVEKDGTCRHLWP